MTFKEFESWCNDRAADGCWGIVTAIICIELVDGLRKVPFWKREKVWREQYENQVINGIVIPIERIRRRVVNHGTF